MEDITARKAAGTPLAAGVAPGAPALSAAIVHEPARPAGEVVSLGPARRSRVKQEPPRTLPDVPVQLHIGRQLRSLYAGVLREPVPDRFLALLEELDRQAGDADDKK